MGADSTINRNLIYRAITERQLERYDKKTLRLNLQISIHVFAQFCHIVIIIYERVCGQFLFDSLRPINNLSVM